MKPASRFTRLIIPALLVLVLSASACNNPLPQGQGGETIVVTDGVGREVTVPAKVERIGCLFAFSGHTVAMLGRAQDIVAVTEGLHRDLMLTTMFPSVLQATVPTTSGTLNIEELMRVDPDIVFVQESTLSSEGETEKLDKAGIPYFVVSYTSIEEQKTNVEMIGRVIGREEEAGRFNQYYQECIDYVKARAGNILAADRVRLYHSVNEATRTDVRKTIPAEWTELAGARNVSLDQELRLLGDKHYASLEQILLWNPDVIIVNEDGVAEYIQENPQWSPLKAVKQGKVYQLPNGVSRWGHPNSLETPLALLWTAKLLYPDLFDDLDMVQRTKDFYREFFDYELSGEQAESILSGVGMRVPK